MRGLTALLINRQTSNSKCWVENTFRELFRISIDCGQHISCHIVNESLKLDRVLHQRVIHVETNDFHVFKIQIVIGENSGRLNL